MENIPFFSIHTICWEHLLCLNMPAIDYKDKDTRIRLVGNSSTLFSVVEVLLKNFP